MTRKTAIREGDAALLGQLSHKIRNPLHAMHLNLKVIDRLLQKWPGRDGAKAQSHLGFVTSDLQLLSDIITQFTELLSPQDARKTRVSLAALVRGGLSALPPNLRGGVRIAGGSGDLLLRVNATQIEAALNEIITNAIEASAGKKEVTIFGEKTKSEHIIAIADQGPGVSARDREKIFEPFYTTMPGRVGLGLYRARLFVEANQGQVTVSPGAAGGAVFKLRFKREAGR